MASPPPKTQIFTPVFDELAFSMKAVTLMGSFVPLFRVFAVLTKSKPIANLVSYFITG